MQSMFAKGFLGTGAPFFMDLVTLIVALLPFLVYRGILFARKGWYELHRWYQWGLFLFSLIIFGWFEYGVRVGGGFRSYVDTSHWPRVVLFTVLILHILIAVLTVLWWARTLARANRHYRHGNLPGGYTLRHIRAGSLTAIGIFLTSLSGLWIYLMLFVF